MAEPATTTKSKGIRRLQIGLNLLVQLILIFFLVSAVNWVGFRHYKRWDVSRNQKYTLSDKTKQVVKGLKKPVKMIVFFTSGSDVLSDLERAMREHVAATESANGALTTLESPKQQTVATLDRHVHDRHAGAFERAL